jgi:predicted TPR repeat methyltransferase
MGQDEATRELSLDEAVALANLLQRNERLDEADALYRAVLEKAPQHVDALHFAGVLAHRLGRHDDAVALIEQSLALASDRADCYNNLGIVLQSTGRLDAAISAYRRAIALDPRHANAHSNLGVLLRASGRPLDAEASYRTAIELDAGHADAYTNLGILLNGLKRTDEAVACFCKAITLRPRHPDARRLLALAHCTLGEVNAAVAIFDEWLAEEPDNPVALHMRAACTGSDVPPRASNGFVERTFDGFAASFESKLQKLSYRAPALVAATVRDAGLQPEAGLDVLDAGCGTGLCGPLMAPYAARLVGVDLSGGMLAHAREKGVYHALVQAELSGFLRDNVEAFDLIVSADTLVYFGALDEVFGRAAAALRPNGLLGCTLERLGIGGDATDHRLEMHGRYSHAESYVERVLAGAGLRAEIAHAELRLEAGTPVAGLVIRARKQPRG